MSAIMELLAVQQQVNDNSPLFGFLSFFPNKLTQ